MNSESCTSSFAEKRHYLLRADYDHLMDLLPGDDHEFPGDRDSSASLHYPKTIVGAHRELVLRGLKCDVAILRELVDGQIVKTDGEQWSKDDIDAAAEWLYEDESHWDSFTHYCWVNNLRFGQCIKARRVAAALFRLPFTLSFDPLGLASFVEPAEGSDDYGFIRFFPKGTKGPSPEVSR